jgi:aminopeptidase N
MGEVRRLIEGDEASDGQLDVLLAQLATPLATEFGWDDHDGDTAQTLRLRGLAISLAASGKVKAVLDEGLKRFRAAKQPAGLPASTRSVMYYTAARYGAKEDFQKLLKWHNSVDSADEKEELASGLTSVKQPAHYNQLIKLLDTDTVRRQDLMHWYVWLLRNRYSRQATWQWLVDHWDWILQEFSSDKTFAYFARYAGSVFSKKDEQEQFLAFFGPKKQVVALTRDVTLAEQEIASRLAWRARNETAVKQWLSKH